MILLLLVFFFLCYAGFSIWNWHTLPVYIRPRYIDYARANASIECPEFLAPSLPELPQ